MSPEKFSFLTICSEYGAYSNALPLLEPALAALKYLWLALGEGGCEKVPLRTNGNRSLAVGTFSDMP